MLMNIFGAFVQDYISTINMKLIEFIFLKGKLILNFIRSQMSHPYLKSQMQHNEGNYI